MTVKKALLFLTSFVFMTIYTCVCNKNLMQYFTNDFKNSERPELFHLDKYKYGDLYGLSYLKEFKEQNKPVADDRKIKDSIKNIDLWCIGDSYLASEMIPGKADSFLFRTCLKSFSWHNTSLPQRISFDKPRKKLLMIEVTERDIRGDFGAAESATNDYTSSFYTIYDSAASSKGEKSFLQGVNELSKWRLIPENINQNIETIFFGYQFQEPLKEIKAEFNYKSFNRLSPSVSISNNNRNIYYRRTIDTNYSGSSFRYISNKEINSIILTINNISRYYKSIGFDEVLFSFIPNPVTILENGSLTYNNLIPRIQNSKESEAKFIDIYNVFKKYQNPFILYNRTDSHWTSEGFKLWVDELNKVLHQL
jgi:hypothetical protein